MSNNFAKEIEDRKNAYLYFPNLFNEDLTISSDVNLDEVEKQYLSYCKMYFTSFTEEDNKTKLKIQDAYKYLRKSLENKENKHHITTNYTSDFLYAYNDLLEEISKYSFNSKSDTSYGATQNKTNSLMLIEISMLKPVLYKIVENIERYLADKNQPTVAITDKLEELTNRLFEMRDYVLDAAYDYHCGWIESTSYSTSKYDGLGCLRNAWKKLKNSAFREILVVYKELIDLINYIEPENNMNNETINIPYKKAINSIVTGPNYYSYLTYEEKVKMDTENKERKANRISFH